MSCIAIRRDKDVVATFGMQGYGYAMKAPRSSLCFNDIFNQCHEEILRLEAYDNRAELLSQRSLRPSGREI